MSETTLTNRLLPWFGADTDVRQPYAEALRGNEFVCVLFAGGMSIVPELDARQILVNDLHRHAINLASVVAHPIDGPRLYRRLRRMPFHPDIRENAVGLLREMGEVRRGDIAAAESYFVAVWMGRSGKAGTKGELGGGLSQRYNASGGGSAIRFQSAARGTVAFRRAFRRCEFSCLDCFELLPKLHDKPRHAIYADPPFPGPGENYLHSFDEKQHRRLAERLGRFQQARIVCRFYEHELIRELYPESQWRWTSLESRKQTNEIAAEVMLIRN